MIRALILALTLCVSSARAATPFVPCTITDWNQVLTVFIVGAPLPIINSQYDLETSYLWVLFNNYTAQFFVNVPLNAVQGQVKWASISGYNQALVQQGTWCPIQLNTGKPLLTR